MILELDFKHICCEESFYIFNKQNFIRIICFRIVKHKYFDKAVMYMIFFSSLKLVVETYIDPKSTSESSILALQISNKIDIGLNIFFSIEAFMKAVAYGFFLDKNSYLKESWNVLDFFIVVSAILDMTLEGVDLSFIKILRLLRTLRPLRFISHNLSMKLLVSALLESVSGIFNVLIVVVMIWMMFAILGINLLKDKLGYCGVPNIYLYNKADCLANGYAWKN